jgi:hypothetical protein
MLRYSDEYSSEVPSVCCHITLGLFMRLRRCFVGEHGNIEHRSWIFLSPHLPSKIVSPKDLSVKARHDAKFTCPAKYLMMVISFDLKN